MSALAQEAIHVSKTPTRLEDNEKAWQVTQAKLKVVNDSQREEQRALTAKQQAEATDKETAEYTDEQLLGDQNYKTGLGDTSNTNDKQNADNNNQRKEELPHAQEDAFIDYEENDSSDEESSDSTTVYGSEKSVKS